MILFKSFFPSLLSASLLLGGVDIVSAQSRGEVRNILELENDSVKKSEELLADIDNIIIYLKEVEPKFGISYDIIVEDAVNNIYKYVEINCGTNDSCREEILEIGLSLLKKNIQERESFDFEKFLSLAGLTI